MDPDDSSAHPALEDLDLPARSAGTGAPAEAAAVPTPVALLTAADLRNAPAASPTAGRPGWALLAIVALVAAMLGVVVVHADISRIADPGWRDNALWATGAALVLLGAALGTVAWTIATEDAGSTLPRVAVLAAVIGGVGAVLVVGLADEQGGEVARSSATAVPAVTSDTVAPPEPEPPLGLNDALNAENLTSASLVVAERTLVTLDLTPAGNQFLAGAMGCRPQDLRNNEVLGTAIGGTWVQPLVVVGSPVKEDGSLVARCRRTTVRLPLAAGTALPRL